MKKRRKMVVRKIARPRYRTRYIRAKRTYRRATGSGLFQKLIPIVAGAVDSKLDPILPIDGVGAFGMGMLMKNNTLATIGGYKIGYSAANTFLGGGGSVNGGGFL